MSTSDVIITQDLALGYEHLPIVENITIKIHSGEFIGILGPNGSGKSTFLRALLGLIQPLSGKLLVLGSQPHRGHIKIGYMPQMRTHISIANLTSRAILEISYNGTRYGIPIFSKSKKTEIQKILELVKADYYADRPFHQLSGGERQRIFLAEALLGNPSLLLLDEPLSNLDPHYQETFVNLLKDIQQNVTVTILFTAHDPNPLLDVMSRVLYFVHGNVVIGTIDDIITSSTLSSLYGIAIEVVRFKNRLFVLGDRNNIHAQEPHHHA
jgi:zinc/manganese transport system ATP-binding protein